jgi:hypothetical protein
MKNTDKIIMSDAHQGIVKTITKQPYLAILSILGLFIPVTPVNYGYLYKIKGYGFGWTITIGHIPVGWIIVVIDLIIKYI